MGIREAGGVAARGFSRRSFVAGAAGMAGALGVAASLADGTAAVTAFAGEASGVGESDGENAFVDFAERPGAGEGAPMRFGAARAGAAPIAPVEVPAAWDVEADVVVVGMGLGGLSAALYAAQQGARVVALEKSGIVGGAARHASNLHCNMGGTKLQTEVGYAWPNETFDPDNPEDVKDACAAFLEPYGYSVDSKLLMREVSDGPRWIDWLAEQDGFELEAAATLPFYPLRDTVIAETGQNDVLGNDHMINALAQDLIDAGVDLRCSTPCTALVAQDGAVVGVQAEGPEGTLSISAARGVILTAGGMGYNLDLLEKYIPTAYQAAAAGGPTTDHTGECIRMGLGVGADMAGFNSFSAWNGALDDYWGDGGTGSYYSYMWRPTSFLSYLPFLSIDRNGNRVPFYRGGANGYVNPRYQGYPFNSGMGAHVAAYMSVGDRRKYMIWDADYLEHFQNEWKGTVWEWYDPQLVCYSGLSEEGAKYLPESARADYDQAIANGSIRRADTLEELAELCGFAPEVFVKAVDEWNACVEAGEDTGLIVPIPAEWMTPVKKPPFYCAPYGVAIGKTLCGLRVNDRMQVMGVDHEPIPGLYAGWSTAGGFTGENDISDFGACTPMGSVAMSGASGWFAARGVLGEYDEA